MRGVRSARDGDCGRAVPSAPDILRNHGECPTRPRQPCGASSTAPIRRLFQSSARCDQVSASTSIARFRAARLRQALMARGRAGVPGQCLRRYGRRQWACMRWCAAGSTGVPRSITVVIACMRIAGVVTRKPLSAPITYVDPSVGKITLTEWVNQWYPALDLEPTANGSSGPPPTAPTGPRPAASDAGPGGRRGPVPGMTDTAWPMAVPGQGFQPPVGRGRRPPHQRYRDRPVCGLWSRVAAASAARFVRPACPRAARE